MAYFNAAKDRGLDHWRVSWYLAQVAEQDGNISLAKESVRSVIKDVPVFSEAQEMLVRLKGIAPDDEDGEERFAIGCPHCAQTVFVSHQGTWGCPQCNGEFVC